MTVLDELRKAHHNWFLMKVLYDSYPSEELIDDLLSYQLALMIAEETLE